MRSQRSARAAIRYSVGSKNLERTQSNVDSIKLMDEFMAEEAEAGGASCDASRHMCKNNSVTHSLYNKNLFV